MHIDNDNSLICVGLTPSMLMGINQGLLLMNIVMQLEKFLCIHKVTIISLT